MTSASTESSGSSSCTTGESERLMLVTALYDLARRGPRCSRPTVEEYLAWGEFVFGLDHDIVFYVDADLEPEVRERREAHGLMHRTAINPVPLERLPAYALLEAISSARRRHPLVNGNPDKDTPLYTVLVWSKFELLRQVLAQPPFPATHVSWIDLGLAKSAVTDHSLEDGVFTNPGDGVHLLMTRSPLAAELADRRHYLSYHWGQISAGYISGDTTSVAQLSELVLAEARAALELGYAANDEQLLALVHQRCSAITFHYGDYPHVLENYRHLRGSADNLLFQLRHCRNPKHWDRARAREIATGIVASCRAGTFECDPRMLAELLEECMMAVFCGDFPNRSAALEVAELYQQMARADAEFRDAFLRNEIRVRTNFAALSETGEFAAAARPR
jgi:hypothetical protein